MNYKFKVGDKVKVIESGHGFSSDSVGKVLQITQADGIYFKGPGYKTEPKCGNCESGALNGFVGELSFKLAQNTDIENQVQVGDLVTNIENMYENIYMVINITNNNYVCIYVCILLISKNSPLTIGHKILLCPTKVEKIKDLKLALKIAPNEL